MYFCPRVGEQWGNGQAREAVVEWTQQLKLPLPRPVMHVVHWPVSRALKEEDIHELL